jgi:hypothetical protein
MKRVIIVPYRAGDRSRERLWGYCRRRWSRTGLEVIVGDHDGDPFSRSRAINVAADSAAWDAAVIVDADVFLDDEGQALAAFAVAENGGGYTSAYDEFWMLDGEGTDAVLDGADPGSQQPYEQWVNWQACFAITRRLWDDVGGFDERFVGNGGQDIAFLAAAGTIGGRSRVTGRCYHLDHPPASRDHPYFQPNMALVKRYTDALEHKNEMRLILEERA